MHTHKKPPKSREAEAKRGHKPEADSLNDILDLAVRHHNAGRLQKAEQGYKHILQAAPDHPGALHMLGVLVHQAGNQKAAIALIGKSLMHNPRNAEAYTNLGIVLELDGKIEDAIKCLRTALQLQPGFAASYYNLATVLQRVGNSTEAETCYRRAVEIDPHYAEAFNNIANIVLHQGRIDEAQQHYRKALSLQPDYLTAHSNLLFCLNYQDIDADVLFTEHQRWGELHGGMECPAEYPNSPDPDRKLRIGLVSPDLRSHPVASFLQTLLENHDPDAVAITCYADVKHPDAVTSGLRSLVEGWRDIRGKSDREVANTIRTDGIDILIDMAGHTAGNRLLLFARKPAPIQVSYLGYPNTTGLKTVDYFITDNRVDPPGAPARYTEELVKLPVCFLCFSPPACSPPVGPLPALAAGHITFGSFNTIAKLTPRVVEHWASILHAVPDSQLILKGKSFRDKTARQHCSDLFIQQGIPGKRIELIGWTASKEQHLALYNRVDIALDTFPYNGTTTTCEALWMGVPVVTLAGSRHAGRVGVSLMHATGMSQLVTDNPESYRQLAVSLAADKEQLTNMRQQLRSRLSASALLDGRRHARDMEQAWRDLWRRWCRKSSRAG